ncbi:MAG: sodium:proton antiporter [Phycisphaerales bacterium]
MSTHLSVSHMHENEQHGDGQSQLHHARTRSSPIGWISMALGAGITGWLIWHSFQPGGFHSTTPAVTEHAPRLWGIGIIPFIALLAAIAVLPLMRKTQHWWESNINRLTVSLVCAGLTILYTVIFVGMSDVVHVLEHAIVAEYIPFIVLLFSLYVISGGIRVTGDMAARPSTNTAFLAIGAGLASFVGTTGASMLLIRPLLQTNQERKYVVHTVVFFIFLVSNIGGSLLPIGDPPLFLGYLKGVPFLWTFVLTPEWAFATVTLLIVYYVLDRRMYAKEDVSSLQRDAVQKEPLRIAGLHNFLWLGAVVFAVALLSPGREYFGFTVFPFLREIVMLALVGVSLLLTSHEIHRGNQFNYHAILEVAALFVGIFIAMQIPVQVLNLHGSELGLTEPWHFFWATGGLSAFLDNAPTYVVFFETANAMQPTGGEGILTLKSGHFIREDLLIGISLGAVFLGAMTYIGNGPNFMVKSIAEQAGVRMPSFFGYLFKYAIVILGPLFVVMTLLFL